MKHSLTASTLLHRLVLSIELGTEQTETEKFDPARKFKCTTAARETCTFYYLKAFIFCLIKNHIYLFIYAQNKLLPHAKMPNSSLQGIELFI